MRGRPESKLKWYLIWARRFAAYLAGRPLHLSTHDDAKGFLTTLASSPRISGWQVEQATDALTILLGSVFGQALARAIRIPALPPPPDVPLPKGDEPGGSSTVAGGGRCSVSAARGAVIWRRYAAHGSIAVAGKGHRPGSPPDLGPGREETEGPDDGSSLKVAGAAHRPSC